MLDTLENPNARFVLTIHSKPKAVLIGAEAFLEILRGPAPKTVLLALQLGALVQGLESSTTSDRNRRTRRTRRGLSRFSLALRMASRHDQIARPPGLNRTGRVFFAHPEMMRCVRAGSCDSTVESGDGGSETVRRRSVDEIGGRHLRRGWPIMVNWSGSLAHRDR